MLIPPRPILSDPAARPVLYTLTKRPDGFWKVTDSLGNNFHHVKVLHANTHHYQCSRLGCQFEVRVNEAIKEFLHGSNRKHNHGNHPTTAQGIQPAAASAYEHDELNKARYNFTDTSSSSSDSSTDNNSYMEIPVTRTSHTPFNTHTTHTRPRPPALDACFTRSSDRDSDSDASLALTDLCDHLDSSTDRYSENDEAMATIPAAFTSSSSEGETDVIRVAYSYNNVTSSGERALLTDSLGYMYNIKFKIDCRVFWCCTQKSPQCPATVLQQRGHFTRGIASHSHSPTSKVSLSANHTANFNQNCDWTSVPVHGSSRTSPGMETREKQLVQHPKTTTITTACLEPCPAPPSKPASQSQAQLTTTSSRQQKRTPSPNVTYDEISISNDGVNGSKYALITSDGFMFDDMDPDVNDQSQDDLTMVRVWRCTRGLKSSPCPAMVKLRLYQNMTPHSIRPLSNSEILDSTPHNHSPDQKAVTTAKVKFMMRCELQAAKGDNLKPMDVLTPILTGCNRRNEVFRDFLGRQLLNTMDLHHLPRAASLKSYFYRQKAIIDGKSKH